MQQNVKRDYPYSYIDSTECSCEEDPSEEEQLILEGIEELEIHRGVVKSAALLLDAELDPPSCEECERALLGIGEECHGCRHEHKLQYYVPQN